MSKSPGNKALRKGRRSLKGQDYLVTTNTVGRRPLLNAPEAAKVLLDSLCWFDQQGYPHWYCRALANSEGDGVDQKIAAKSRSYISVEGRMLEQ